ncbi:hypothetical protein JXO59_15270 [candidate division KSB1 bacterium]|nr:hypothetical protein [candidate division KSB1 bacterium]
MDINTDDTPLNYCYQFKLPDQTLSQIDIKIDRRTIALIPPEEAGLPDWVKLDFEQCPNCPLKVKETPYCPVARNLMPLIDLCSSLASYTEMDVCIIAPDRVINARTTAQRAVSSVLGLIMATSACPHTAYLKPMARFHVPLSGEEEAIYRTTSMYLLAQYFKSKKGLSHDYDIAGLTEIYDNLKTVNRAMARRLKAAISQDAAVNAVILLDLLSQAVTWSIEDGLEEIAYLFKSYTAEST